ncbi:hypothetical protein D3C72_2350160 [compost metagenome]
MILSMPANCATGLEIRSARAGPAPTIAAADAANAAMPITARVEPRPIRFMSAILQPSIMRAPRSERPNTEALEPNCGQNGCQLPGVQAS